MLKHFRSRVSAQVEQLCLLAKLWTQLTQFVAYNDNDNDEFNKRRTNAIKKL